MRSSFLKRMDVLSIGCFILALSACSAGPVTNDRVKIDQAVPRSDKSFLNNPNDFQFVIVGDRTGGHRPGVFDRAMDQVNWLQPEFVMCVGDLIEGYTDDTSRLQSEWDELDGMISKLNMTFFYTVGNHDMGNNVMREMWLQRHGRDYYHFIYKDVLFISLNTEDPPVALSEETLARQARLEKMMEEDPIGTQQRILERSKGRAQSTPLPGSVAISDEQVSYVEKALADNPDVRWTLVFMHKPAWHSDNAQFQRIEELVKQRPYTMIAGHEHYYTYDSRNGRDYIDMGTTGGIWLNDGPGKLDHIAWVTMTDEGPLFANIKLDGLLDKHGPQ